MLPSVLQSDLCQHLRLSDTAAVYTAPCAPDCSSNRKKTVRTPSRNMAVSRGFSPELFRRALDISELTRGPRPVPVSPFVLTNGSKSVLLISGLIPDPVSAIVKRIRDAIRCCVRAHR